MLSNKSIFLVIRCRTSTAKAVLIAVGVFCISIASFAHDKHTSDKHAESFVRNISKGARIEIDALGLCKQLVQSCKPKDIVVETLPVEGILFENDASGVWAYQHAGTSTNNDHIQVAVTVPDQTKIHFSVQIEISALLNARVRIVSPKNGDMVNAGTLVVEYSTSGTDFDHLHLQLDGIDHVSLYPRQGRHEFYDVTPGKYKISATLARSDHRAIISSRREIEIEVLE